MFLQDLATLIGDPLTRLWGNSIAILGSIVAAAVVLIIGLIAANALGKLVEELINRIHIDKALTSLGLKEHFDRAGINMNSGKFLGRLVYWFFTVVFLLAASDILGFTALSEFLRQAVAYIPNVIVAVLMMLAAAVMGNFLRHVVRASVKSAGFHTANFLGSLTMWSVVVFGFFAALTQLGIAVQLINALITGFVAMLAIAGGIAFGMGGKDYANHLVTKFREHIER